MCWRNEQRNILKLFSEMGAIEPLYLPDELGRRGECSNILRQCIDAMVTNCDRFGYRLVPVIDLEHEDADQMIADVIYRERLDAAEDQGQTDVPEASAQEVQARKKVIASEMRKEHVRLSVFLDYCCPELSFTELRARGHQDKETNGNWYWEVIRNGLGRVVELRWQRMYSGVNTRQSRAAISPSP
jgi:capsid portal protein